MDFLYLLSMYEELTFKFSFTSTRQRGGGKKTKSPMSSMNDKSPVKTLSNSIKIITQQEQDQGGIKEIRARRSWSSVNAQEPFNPKMQYEEESSGYTSPQRLIPTENQQATLYPSMQRKGWGQLVSELSPLRLPDECCDASPSPKRLIPTENQQATLYPSVQRKGWGQMVSELSPLRLPDECCDASPSPLSSNATESHEITVGLKRQRKGWGELVASLSPLETPSKSPYTSPKELCNIHIENQINAFPVQTEKNVWGATTESLSPLRVSVGSLEKLPPEKYNTQPKNYVKALTASTKRVGWEAMVNALSPVVIPSDSSETLPSENYSRHTKFQGHTVTGSTKRKGWKEMVDALSPLKLQFESPEGSPCGVGEGELQNEEYSESPQQPNQGWGAMIAALSPLKIPDTSPETTPCLQDSNNYTEDQEVTVKFTRKGKEWDAVLTSVSPTKQQDASCVNCKSSPCYNIKENEVENPTPLPTKPSKDISMTVKRSLDLNKEICVGEQYFPTENQGAPKERKRWTSKRLNFSPMKQRESPSAGASPSNNMSYISVNQPEDQNVTISITVSGPPGTSIGTISGREPKRESKFLGESDTCEALVNCLLEACANTTKKYGESPIVEHGSVTPKKKNVWSSPRVACMMPEGYTSPPPPYSPLTPPPYYSQQMPTSLRQPYQMGSPYPRTVSNNLWMARLLERMRQHYYSSYKSSRTPKQRIIYAPKSNREAVILPIYGSQIPEMAQLTKSTTNSTKITSNGKCVDTGKTLSDKSTARQKTKTLRKGRKTQTDKEPINQTYRGHQEKQPSCRGPRKVPKEVLSTTRHHGGSPVIEPPNEPPKRKPRVVFTSSQISEFVDSIMQGQDTNEDSNSYSKNSKSMKNQIDNNADTATGGQLPNPIVIIVPKSRESIAQTSKLKVLSVAQRAFLAATNTKHCGNQTGTIGALQVGDQNNNPQSSERQPVYLLQGDTPEILLPVYSIGSQTDSPDIVFVKEINAAHSHTSSPTSPINENETI